MKRRSIHYAVVMGILTILFGLVVADGMLNMYAYHTSRYWSNVAPGYVVFLVSVLGLPLIFIKKVKWKDTIINFPLFFLLYFPVDMIFGNSREHLFLGTGGLDFPKIVHALIVAIVFWGLQSITYFLCFIGTRILRRINNKKFHK